MFKPTSLALASLVAVTSAVPYGAISNNTDIPTIFKPAALTPFLHINQLTAFPVNVSTLAGVTARYPNLGGDVSGVLNGTLVNIGAAFETLPDGPEGVNSWYTNTFTINTTDALLNMDARATISYANSALHGFGWVTFATDSPKYKYLVWGSYVAEFEANYNTGVAYIDVFKLNYTGKRDGSDAPALLAPGTAWMG